LQRLGLAGQITQYLDWMLPAPAQGAMAVAVRAQDTAQQERLAPLHDPAAALCTQIERDLLNALEGGCSAPLGAHATVEADGAVRLRACLLTLDGAQRLDLDERAPRAEAAALGHRAAQTALARGAGPMLETIERQAQGEAS
jgi:hydroxymethylbilane synthase